MQEEFGRLETLPIRQAWSDEARDFTPWLLANADRLGEVLTMDLALHEAEHAVGSFSLDLLGVDTATGERVVVENQLERSDHRHLGQLLTYAAGVGASIAIWVADSFREEHLAALQWLNANTHDGIALFAVEVSVARIGDSLKAPVFTVRERPNEWGRSVRAREQAHSSMQPYREFWQSLMEYIATERPAWPLPRKAPAQSWLSFPGPVRGVKYTVRFRDQTLRVGLGLSSRTPGANSQMVTALAPVAEELQSKFGTTVTWEGPHSQWQGYDLEREISVDAKQVLQDPDQSAFAQIVSTMEVIKSVLERGDVLSKVELISRN